MICDSVSSLPRYAHATCNDSTSAFDMLICSLLQVIKAPRLYCFAASGCALTVTKFIYEYPQTRKN